MKKISSRIPDFLLAAPSLACVFGLYLALQLSGKDFSSLEVSRQWLYIGSVLGFVSLWAGVLLPPSFLRMRPLVGFALIPGLVTGIVISMFLIIPWVFSFLSGVEDPGSAFFRITTAACPMICALRLVLRFSGNKKIPRTRKAYRVPRDSYSQLT